MRKKFNPANLKLWQVILLVFMAVMTGVGIFTSNTPSWASHYSLGNYGTLGDAVNGLTAPVISFCSMILIYITFKEQNRANRLQLKANQMLQSQWKIDSFIKLFDSMEEKLRRLRIPVEDVNFMGSSLTRDVIGIDTLKFVARQMTKNISLSRRYLNEICFVFDDFVLVSRFARESPESERALFVEKAWRFYFEYLNDGSEFIYEMMNTQLDIKKELKQDGIEEGKWYERFIITNKRVKKSFELLTHERYRLIKSESGQDEKTIEDDIQLLKAMQELIKRFREQGVFIPDDKES